MNYQKKKIAMSRIIILLVAAMLPIFLAAQPAEVAAKRIRATEKLQLSNKTLTAIVESISVLSTHAQSPTAKAVYDLTAAMITSVSTNATLSGNGTTGSPLTIAQQGATSGQVLKWNGTTWLPSTDNNTTYTGGTGIDVTGTIITNTAPNINQTISTTGAAGNITLSNGGGTLNLNVNDADANATNEIQTLSYSPPNLSLSLGGGSVAIPQGTVTGTVINNNLPKGNGTTALQSSLTYDDGTTVSIANSGTNLSAGRLEIAKTYTNTTDGNVVLTGNIPLLTFRGTRRFAIGNGYTASDKLSFLGVTADNANPTTELFNVKSNADFQVNGGLIYGEFASAIFGGASHAFGTTTVPSGVGFISNLSAGQSFRINSAGGGVAYTEFYGPGTGSNRNYAFAQNYFSTGDFNLLQSSTAGGAPNQNIFSISQSTGNMGIGINSAAAKLDVNGNFKLTTRTGTATTIAGWGSDNISRDLVLGTGLSITSGTLNASGTIGGTGAVGKVAYFSGANAITSTTNFPFDGTNLAVGRSTAGAGRFNVTGNSTSVCAQFDAGTLPNFGSQIQSTGTTANGNSILGLDLTGTTTGSTTNYLHKLENNGTGSTILQLNTAAAGGSPMVQYNLVGGSGNWVHGMDKADANKFKIKPYTGVGTSFGSNGITITTAGLIGVNNESPGASIDMDATTDGIALSSGNTANRPTTGLRWFRYNTSMAGLETRTIGGVWHVLNSANSVTLTAGAGLGTAPTITVNNGTEMAYTVSLEVGTAPTANAVIFTRTFPNTWSVAPTPTFTQANQLTASEYNKFYVDTQTTGQYTIRANGTLTAGQTYKLNIRLGN
jgi:hypothetical protein